MDRILNVDVDLHLSVEDGTFTFKNDYLDLVKNIYDNHKGMVTKTDTTWEVFKVVTTQNHLKGINGTFNEENLQEDSKENHPSEEVEVSS